MIFAVSVYINCGFLHYFFTSINQASNAVMLQIVSSCPRTKLEGLQSAAADDGAVQWPMKHGSREHDGRSINQNVNSYGALFGSRDRQLRVSTL